MLFSGILNLVKQANPFTPLVLSNSGTVVVHKVGGTLNTADAGAGAASIVNQSATSYAAILGGTAAQRGIITGPTLPAAADVQSGAADYGYAGGLLDPVYPTTATTNAAHLAADKVTLNANLDEMIVANDSIRAVYDCDAGTAPSGGNVIIVDEG